MIYLDSRYADGPLFKANNARDGNYYVTVMRQFPSYAIKFFWYEWVETDRLDDLSARFLGNPEYWWQILDVNPEILDPFEISAGTPLRIPNE